MKLTQFSEEEQIFLKKLDTDKFEQILPALKQIEESGKPEYLPILFDLKLNSQIDLVQRELNALFIGLKVQAAADLIMSAVADPLYAEIKSFLISLAWQTSLDFSDYFDEFVRIFVSEPDFMVAFEAYTVIENMDHHYAKFDLPHLVAVLKEESLSIHADKKELIVELIHKFQDIIENGFPEE